MILCVFEGEKRELEIFRTIEYLFFSSKDENIICSYNNNIYNLYREMHKTEFILDIVTLIKDKLISDNDNPHKYFLRSNFAEVYLFFDYDRQNNSSHGMSDIWLQEMLKFFDNETENGKLYVNYPMLESIRYVKSELPDENYYSYTSNLSIGKDFKEIAKNKSYYKEMDWVKFKMNSKTQKVHPHKEMFVRKNWQYLQEMNVKKANFICSGKNEFPQKKDDISQKNIFNNQLKKYITPKQEVAILNSFPLFLYDYKGRI